jgi:hypothetical protein
MPKVMVTIQGPGEPPTVAELRRRYQLDESEIDASFGVVEVDPTEHVYTVLVEESAAAKVRPDQGWTVQGPYSNPRVEPFGPPQ